MIQGGDPNTKDPELISLWGTGGPDHSVDVRDLMIYHMNEVLYRWPDLRIQIVHSQFFIDMKCIF